MTAKPPRSAPPHASSSPFADCLAVDQRRLRSHARDLRHLFGGKREALSAEHDRLLGQSRAAVAARRARWRLASATANRWSRWPRRTTGCSGSTPSATAMEVPLGSSQTHSG